MTLSIDGYPGDVSRRVTYLSASSPARPIASAGKEHVRQCECYAARTNDEEDRKFLEGVDEAGD